MGGADNLATFMCRLSWNPGALISWNLHGLSRVCLAFTFTLRIYFFNIHFNITLSSTKESHFLFRVSEGPWNINVNAWGFFTLDYFYKWWTSGINDDWDVEEKPVITAGYTVVVTCLQGSITCTGAYHFTAAHLIWVCQSECNVH